MLPVAPGAGSGGAWPEARSALRIALRITAVCALVLGAAGAARAAYSPQKQAGVHLARAAELYQGGSYAGAITELRAAYALNPLPRILCNLAKAYRKNGQVKEAAEHYDLCLRTDPQLSAQERGEFTALLEQLRAQLRAAEPPSSPPIGPAQRPASPPTTVTPKPAEPEPAPALGGEPGRPIYKRAWFWGVVGGVAAVGIIATVAGVAATRSSAPMLVDPPLPMGVPVFAWQ